MKYATKYVDRIEDIPAGEHWAIIRNRSVHVPGDERSRTAPGHGYPEHTEHSIALELWDSEADMIAELERTAGRYDAGIGIRISAIYRAVPTVRVEKIKE